MSNDVRNITLNLSTAEFVLIKEALAFYTTMLELADLRKSIPVDFEQNIKPLRKLIKRLDGK